MGWEIYHRADRKEEIHLKIIRIGLKHNFRCHFRKQEYWSKRIYSFERRVHPDLLNGTTIDYSYIRNK